MQQIYNYVSLKSRFTHMDLFSMANKAIKKTKRTLHYQPILSILYMEKNCQLIIKISFNAEIAGLRIT